MRLNISPNPTQCANRPGGVNSVIADHALGFLAAGCEIGANGADINIVHAMAEANDIDIFHNHGLYPIGPGYFDPYFSRANDTLLRNALKAKVTICISEFSANILRHKLHIDPVVTRNGIWTQDYRRGGSMSGPVLFPKAALDANAKADDVLWLKSHTNLNLLSIAKIPGVKSTGRVNREKFIETLSECSIYLGTTKENNSMATMEAMIMGVPVVGYNTGFNAEWLQSGVGCELVAKGDRAALADAIKKVNGNWNKYSAAAREFAKIFDWQPVIDQLLEIYQNINKAPETKTVSIVIPCHNYARWVGEAIESSLAQTIPCEVIVVDDKSTDDSRKVIGRYPVKLIENAQNIGVAETRNAGILAAKGQYIVCLDADDKLHPDFVARHLAAFQPRDIAITCAPILITDESGNTRRQSLFTTRPDPARQAIGRNQVPSACMFRKEFWRRAGGYDGRYTPAEDANLWLKIFSLGGRAVKVSDNPLMDYRTHPNSLSAPGFPTWWNIGIDFRSPIQERDSDTEIILDITESEKEVLWQLESQNYQRWNCQPSNPAKLEQLRQTFPWLNRSRPNPSRPFSRIHLSKPPSQNFLDEYAMQIPEWVGSPLASP